MLQNSLTTTLKNLTYEQFSRLLQGFTIEPGIKKITPPESML